MSLAIAAATITGVACTAVVVFFSVPFFVGGASAVVVDIRRSSRFLDGKETSVVDDDTTGCCCRDGTVGATAGASATGDGCPCVTEPFRVFGRTSGPRIDSGMSTFGCGNVAPAIVLSFFGKASVGGAGTDGVDVGGAGIDGVDVGGAGTDGVDVGGARTGTFSGALTTSRGTRVRANRFGAGLDVVSMSLSALGSVATDSMIVSCVCCVAKGISFKGGCGADGAIRSTGRCLDVKLFAGRRRRRGVDAVCDSTAFVLAGTTPDWVSVIIRSF